MHRYLLTMALVACAAAPAGAQDTRARLELSLEPDQARATLEILGLRAAGDSVPDSLWARLRSTEGYRRFMARERGMDERFGLDRGIDDASFREWALSDGALVGLEARWAALRAWERVDLDRAGSRALAYLPEQARLRGSIYPIVREQTNSFVWDTETDHPAIFMYVEPGKSAAELEHILAHELHHIGSTAACGPSPRAGVSVPAAEAIRWISAFSEGIAVLAAAGGPDGETHPHDPPEVREPWAARLDSLQPDIAELEAFLTAILDAGIPEDQIGPRGMSFINRPGSPQGPFYSVGWHMAAAVERERGRAAIITAVCDPVRLLLDYQDIAAARPGLPAWSADFIDRLRPLADDHPRSPATP
jgi:hypothetical protein